MLASLHARAVRVRSAAVKVNAPGDFFPDGGKRPIQHRSLRVVPPCWVRTPQGCVHCPLETSSLFATFYYLRAISSLAMNILSSFLDWDMRDERASSWRFPIVLFMGSLVLGCGERPMDSDRNLLDCNNQPAFSNLPVINLCNKQHNWLIRAER